MTDSSVKDGNKKLVGVLDHCSFRSCLKLEFLKWFADPTNIRTDNWLYLHCALILQAAWNKFNSEERWQHFRVTTSSCSFLCDLIIIHTFHFERERERDERCMLSPVKIHPLWTFSRDYLSSCILCPEKGVKKENIRLLDKQCASVFISRKQAVTIRKKWSWLGWQWFAGSEPRVQKM